MARRRFFVDEVRKGVAELTGDEARHLTQVLRVEVGQKFEISDNSSLFLAEVSVARRNSVVFQVIEDLPAPETGLQIRLLVSLIKFDRLEWIIEKATELGCTDIHFVESVRSERGLEQAAGKRLVRWRRIALESSQQSRRARLPALHDPILFSEALRISAGQRIFLDEEHSGNALLAVLQERPGAESISLLTGPEGGWTDTERAAAVDAGWLAASLGPRILRTETAVIAALAIVNAVT